MYITEYKLSVSTTKLSAAGGGRRRRPKKPRRDFFVWVLTWHQKNAIFIKDQLCLVILRWFQVPSLNLDFGVINDDDMIVVRMFFVLVSITVALQMRFP